MKLEIELTPEEVRKLDDEIGAYGQRTQALKVAARVVVAYTARMNFILGIKGRREVQIVKLVDMGYTRLEAMRVLREYC